MKWVNDNMVGLSYWFDFISNILPIILAVAIIFTFFLVQSFARQLKIMSFYLDRIDNHLREINYLMKEKRTPDGSAADQKQAGSEDTERGAQPERE